MYAATSSNASEETEKCVIAVRNLWKSAGVNRGNYLMKIVSRSWSRAMKDLVVRYLAKRS